MNKMYFMNRIMDLEDEIKKLKLERVSDSPDSLVGLAAVQAWVDQKPKTKSLFLSYAIKTLIAELEVKDVREVTNYALNVEREKPNSSICGK